MEYALPTHLQFKRGTLAVRTDERIRLFDERIPGQGNRRGMNCRELLGGDARVDEQTRNLDVQEIHQFELDAQLRLAFEFVEPQCFFAIQRVVAQTQ